MNIEIVEVPYEQKSILQHLLELYHYDFSEIDGDELNEYGLYGYKYLDQYWTEEGRIPLFIKVDGKYAGFVLINAYHLGFHASGMDTRSIAEFFVMRKYRHKGIGKYVAKTVFNRYPGSWEVRQTAANTAAQTFWRNVIREYTHGTYEEVVLHDERWNGPIQLFNTVERTTDE
jgi:predicted acetyltransferase